MFTRLFRRKPRSAAKPYARPPTTKAMPPAAEPFLNAPAQATSTLPVDVRRYFHNHSGFQCYTTWFRLWDGWASAGHCVSDAGGHAAGFAKGEVVSWPGGLDAALAGADLPAEAPPAPVLGQKVILYGYPAGARRVEMRGGTVYHERMPGQWIVHIEEPDEPVVVGMSGGPVVDADTLKPIGIIITRNSPADLNADRDPDESADFIALSAVWAAMRKTA